MRRVKVRADLGSHIANLREQFLDLQALMGLLPEFHQRVIAVVPARADRINNGLNERMILPGIAVSCNSRVADVRLWFGHYNETTGMAVLDIQSRGLQAGLSALFSGVSDREPVHQYCLVFHVDSPASATAVEVPQTKRIYWLNQETSEEIAEVIRVHHHEYAPATVA